MGVKCSITPALSHGQESSLLHLKLIVSDLLLWFKVSVYNDIHMIRYPQLINENKWKLY